MINNRQEVVDDIRNRFARTPFDGIGLTVVDEEVYLEGSEWQIPVHPSVEPAKRYPFYEYLADIEGELDHDQINVFLVPAEPLTELAANY